MPENARLYVDGALTTSTSERRTFVSPALPPGRSFHYTLRIEFERDGEPVTINRKVKVWAGSTAELSIGPESE